MSASPDLPESAIGLYTRLMSEEPLEADHLRVQLDAYEEELNAVIETTQFFDYELGTRLIAASRELLSGFDALSEGHRKLAQASIRYLVLYDDADHDFGSIDGLDDDARVHNAVMRLIGRTDLKVELVD